MLSVIKKHLIPLIFSISVLGIIFDLYIPNIILAVPVILLFQVLLFYFCDAVNESDTLTMKLTYAGAAAGLITVTVIGANMNHLYFDQYVSWIFGLSDSTNKWMILSFFALTNFFIGSLIYYCSTVVYNILLNFLLVIMPALLYLKVETVFPRTYMITLCLMFFLTALHCSQGKLKEENCYVTQDGYKWAVALLTGVLVLPVLLLPKGVETPFASYVQMYGTSRNITAGQDTESPSRASGNAHGNSNVNPEKIIYYVKTDEPLYLKRESFFRYDSEVHKWRAVPGGPIINSGMPGDYNMSMTDREFTYQYIAGELEGNPGLLEKYQLTKQDLDVLRNFRGQTKTLELIPEQIKVSLIPYPANARCSLVHMEPEQYSVNEKLMNSLHINPAVEKNTIHLRYTMYRDEPMNRVYEVLKNIDMNELYADLMGGNDSDLEFMNSYWESSQNFIPDRIRSLAEEITRNRADHLDKLRALEAFFHKGDFVYDDQYRAPNPSIEYFLFESKRGACADYATAMALMAQSLDIPVKYTEGYQVVEYDETKGQFVVRRKHGHAFVEGYIPSIGWRVFEPTVSKDNLEPVAAGQNQFRLLDWLKRNQFSALLQFLAIAVLLGCVVYLIRPTAKELLFRIKVKNLDANKAVPAMYRRIWKLLVQNHDATVMLDSKEFCDIIEHTYGFNAKVLPLEFDRIVYGGIVIENLTKCKAYEEYVELYRRIH